MLVKMSKMRIEYVAFKPQPYPVPLPEGHEFKGMALYCTESQQEAMEENKDYGPYLWVIHHIEGHETTDIMVVESFGWGAVVKDARDNPGKYEGGEWLRDYKGIIDG